MKARSPFVLVACVAMAIAVGDTYGQTPATKGLCYATPSGNAAAKNLITIDLATGAGSIIAPLGIESGFPGLAINSAGDIFATGWDGDDGLYRIDAATGAVTSVATMPDGYIGGIAFDDSDVLYGVNADADELVIINTATGAWTPVGAPGPSLYAGLDFDPTDGTLYGSTSGAAIFPVPGGVPDAISTLSTIDGSASVVGVTGLGGGTPSISFDGDGNLFGVKGGGGGVSNLISIDKTTGAGTIVGPIGSGVTGFDCFMDPTPEPEDPVALLDFRAGQCPNVLNKKNDGLVNVALVGSATFDANEVNLSTLALNGVSPKKKKTKVKDFRTLPASVEPGACSEEGGDGFDDIKLKFKNKKIAKSLGNVAHGDVVAVTLTGEFLDGTPFELVDSVRVKIPGKKKSRDDDDDEGDDDDDGKHRRSGKNAAPATAPNTFQLSQNYPNPFNPTTTISFALPEAASVRLTVHNALGQEVRVLVSSTLEAGVHAAMWDATDHYGNRVATGLYFYRLSAGDFVHTRKMLLLE